MKARLLLLFVALILAGAGVVAVLQTASAEPSAVVTPLEQSGLTPLWGENFTGGSIDRMQYTWAKGNRSALNSYVMPGAVYLGKNGGTIQVEQEINNFKAYDGEPLASTLEFDILPAVTGKGRVSIRPRRVGDFAHMRIGNPKDKTSILFSFISGQGGTVVRYKTRTGPSYGWTHVALSYRQFMSGTTLYADYVVAINEEVHEFQGPSGVTNPDWATYWATTPGADGWSIEHNSKELVMGKYIANVRAYSGFLTLSQMQSRLQGRVTPYLAGLADPRQYTGPVKNFQVHKTLSTFGPNAMAYANQIGSLRIRFDGSLSSAWRQITSYNWTFGDGATGSGRLVNHTYSAPGTYTATLTVSNVSGTDSHTITVNVAP